MSPSPLGLERHHNSFSFVLLLITSPPLALCTKQNTSIALAECCVEEKRPSHQMLSWSPLSLGNKADCHALYFQFTLVRTHFHSVCFLLKILKYIFSRTIRTKFSTKLKEVISIGLDHHMVCHNNFCWPRSSIFFYLLSINWRTLPRQPSAP